MEAAPREDVGGRLGSLSDASGESLAASLGASLSQVVGSAVSAAAALVAGTVSGGFGHSLGTALLVGLLGTTGPIGFLIGALGGLVLAAGTFWTGRRYLEGSLRRMHLPGPALRAVLWPGRLRRLLDDGRARCRQQVKDLLQAELEPLVDTIAEQVWVKVRPLIGAQLQAAPARSPGD